MNTLSKRVILNYDFPYVSCKRTEFQLFVLHRTQEIFRLVLNYSAELVRVKYIDSQHTTLTNCEITTYFQFYLMLSIHNFRIRSKHLVLWLTMSRQAFPGYY